MSTRGKAARGDASAADQGTPTVQAGQTTSQTSQAKKAPHARLGNRAASVRASARTPVADAGGGDEDPRKRDSREAVIGSPGQGVPPKKLLLGPPRRVVEGDAHDVDEPRGEARGDVASEAAFVDGLTWAEQVEHEDLSPGCTAVLM